MAERRFLNNEERKRYELHVGEHFALVEYIINNQNVVYLTHTETPVVLEGQGVAADLIGKSLQDIKDNGQKVFPLCPYVIAYIRKHPEWAEIVK